MRITRPWGRLGLRVFSILLLGPVLGCSAETPSAPEAPALDTPALAEGPRAELVLAMEALGEIRIELLPELAPQTVAKVSERATSGLYDGTTFHRVIPEFMIQGGNPNSRDNDPRDDHHNGGGLDVPDEHTGYPMTRGTVAMANSGRPGSTDVHFFIVLADAPHLDGAHNVVGRVRAGMEVVDAIARLEIDRFGRYGPPNRPYPVDARIAKAVVVAPGDRVARQ